MDDEQARGFASVVIRLWYEADDDRWQRVEIEHVQSGTIYAGRDVSNAWITHTLRAVTGRAGAADLDTGG